jgi:hypothetical protein
MFLGTVELLPECFSLPWNSYSHQIVKSGQHHATCIGTCCMCIANQNLGPSKQLPRKFRPLGCVVGSGFLHREFLTGIIKYFDNLWHLLHFSNLLTAQTLRGNRTESDRTGC